MPINNRAEKELRSPSQPSSFPFLNARKSFTRGKKGEIAFLTLRCKGHFN